MKTFTKCLLQQPLRLLAALGLLLATAGAAQAQAPVAASQAVTVQLSPGGTATLQATSVNNGSTGSGNTYTIQKIRYGQVNEGSTLTLTAPTGFTFTSSVPFASYGTPGGSNGNYTVGSCNSGNSASVVNSSLSGQNAGSIGANNNTFGDPCYGTGKSLAVVAAYSTNAASQTYSPAEVGSDNYVLLTATNASGSSTRTAQVTVVPYANNALAFDGNDDYVALPSSTPVPVGNSAYTIEAWIKPTSMGVFGIVGWGNYGSNNQVNALRLDPANGGSLRNYWWANDLNVTVGNLADGKWHHVAATFDGTTRAMYVDGVFKGSDTPSGHNVPNANNMRLGVTCANCPQVNGFAVEYFPGSMDEVRIYNVGLTQAQVQADMFSYSGTAAVPASQKYYANFDQGTAGGNNAGLTSLTDQSGNGSTGTLTNFALTGTSSNWVRSFPTITAISPSSGAVGTSLTLTGTNLTDATGFAFNGTGAVQTTPTNDLTATVAVPGGATTGPVSVFSTTLAKYNGPVFTVTGASASTNNALAFDGTDDYVALPSGLNTANFTFEAWVNYQNTGNWSRIFDFGNGTTNWMALIPNPGNIPGYAGGGNIAFGITTNGGGGAESTIVSSTPLPIGSWHHVAVTLATTGSTTSGVLYLDGTVIGTNPNLPISPASLGTLTQTWLGRSQYADPYLHSSLDEVHVYSAALTQAQVQADMFSTTSALPASLKAYYNFDQGTAGGNNAGITSLTDQSGNGSTGTLTNFALTGTSSNWVRSFPTITGISPTTGKSGTSVTVTGTNLTDATSFAFNGTSTTNFTTPTSDITTTVKAPVGVTTGPVSVASATLAKYNGPVFTLSNDLVVTTTQSIPGDSYSSITVQSGGNGTLAGDVTVSGPIVVQSGGRLADGCNLFTGSGSFTLNAGGTLDICRPRGILSGPNTGLGNVGAVRVLGTRSYSNDASYSYSGNQSQDTGDGLPSQVRNFTVSTASDLSLTNPLAVAQVLTMAGNGNLALGSKALTLLSSSAGTALVVNSGAGVVNGTATVQRYIDASGNTGSTGYRHYSAPVSGMAFSALATTSTGGSFTPIVGSTAYNQAANTFTVMPYPNVYGYDQSRVGSTTLATNLTAFDQGYYSPTSATLTVGQGYTVQIGNGEKVSFTGTLTTGAQTIGGLQRSANAAGGWQLIGNPYPAPLDWGTVGASGNGSSLNGVDPAAYVFQSTSGYAGRYTSFNNGVGAGSGLLATGQAFFVRASSASSPGTVTLTNANRATSYAATPSFQRTAETRPLLRLSLAAGSQPVTTATAQDETFVYFEAGATGDFDGRFDAYKLPNPSGLYLGTAAQVASGALPTGLSIDGRAPLAVGTSLRVPVWLSVAAGTYTLTATELLNFAGMGSGTSVALLDALTGTATSLDAVPSYTFAVAANAPSTGRFTLVFGGAAPLATIPAALAQAQVSLYPNPTEGAATLSLAGLPADARSVQATLSDALGRPVGRVLLPISQGVASAPLPSQGLAGGIYVLRLDVLDAQGQPLGQLPAQRLSVR